MQRSISWLAVLSISALVGCGATPTTRAPVMAPMPDVPAHAGCAAFLDAGGGACAEVTWLGEDRLDVALTIEPEAVPDAASAPVELRWRAKYLGDDYGTRAVEMADGQPWPAAAPLSARRTLRYRVTLDRTLHARYGHGGISFAAPGGWQLIGRSFVPDIWVGDQSVAVPARLTFDPGSSTLVTARGTEARTFDAPTLIELADTSFAIGEWTVRQKTRGETTLYAATGAPDAGDALDDYLGLIDRILGAIEPELGPLPTGRLVAMHHVLPKTRWGTTTVSTSLQSSAEIPRHLSDLAAEVLVHEMLHFWMPGRFVVDDLWISEGLTDYLTIKALARLNDASDLRVARVVQRSHMAYLQGAGERTLADGGRDRWSYDAGIVAGFCIDTHLTATTETTLFEVLGALLKSHPREVLTAADLEAALRARSPQSADLMVAIAETRGGVDLTPCLNEAGFQILGVDGRLLTPKAAVVDVMGLHGLTTSGKTESFVATKVAPGSTFEVGDRILGIGHLPVGTADILALSLTPIEPGQTIAVQVLRRGEPIEIELTMTALPEDAFAPLVVPIVMPRMAPEAPTL